MDEAAMVSSGIDVGIVGGELATLAQSTAEFLEASRASNTVRAYRSDWRHFEGWCQRHGVAALPASETTVALYLADMAGSRKVSTLARRLAAISQAHKAAGAAPPTGGVAARTMVGIRRSIGTAQAGKSPLKTPEIRRLVATCEDDLLGVRDRALLLIGFAGAFRRSELVALNAEDLEFVSEGIVATIRRSKTDQEGQGRRVAIPYGSSPATCPVRSLRAWLDAAGITRGAVFVRVDRWGHLLPHRLSAQAVARVVKRRCLQAGLDAQRFAGHSLRAGLATAAAEAGVAERDIARQTGHRSLAMLRRYIREGSMWRDCAAAKIGL
jgi:site-specific recombinase XerD